MGTIRKKVGQKYKIINKCFNEKLKQALNIVEK